MTRIVWLGLAAVACQQPDTRPGPDPALADSLKARIEAAYDFTRPGVVDRMGNLYPDSGQIVSASGGDLVVSADSIRRGIADFWRNAGQNMRDPKFKWGKVFAERLGPDAGVLTATWSIPHIAPTGRPHTLQGAWTAVFRRIGGNWLIVAEHLSAPASPPP